jgi:chromosome segregation ATPase
MKRDFLKNLGIEDKDVIDKILDENSTDIGKAKGELDTWKTKVTDLENEVKTKDDTIANLQKEADKVEGLNNEISQLKTDKTNLTNELNTKVSEIKKTHAIEGAIKDAKAKSVKSVLPHLDMTKITFENDELNGLSEQLEALKSGEDTSFLFGETTPSGTHLDNPPGGKGGNPETTTSFRDAIEKSLSKK